jgi:hypothetical protein
VALNYTSLFLLLAIFSGLLEVVGNADTIQQLQSGAAPEKIVASWTDALAAFDQVRRKYFLYK